MANTKVVKRVPRKAAAGFPALLARLPDDARKAIAHNRAELEKTVKNVRLEVERRAEAIVRDTERRLLKQMHAATEEQVRRLERRVAKLERAVAARA